MKTHDDSLVMRLKILLRPIIFQNNQITLPVQAGQRHLFHPKSLHQHSLINCFTVAVQSISHDDHRSSDFHKSLQNSLEVIHRESTDKSPSSNH